MEPAPVPPHALNLTRLEAGLDWFSATLPKSHPLGGTTYDTAMAFLEKQHAEGNAAKQCSLLGYKGAICGKCFVGEREDGLLLRSTSGVSTSYYEHCYLPDMHVSRLDLHVTVWLENLTEHYGRQCRASAVSYRESHPREAKRKITTIDSVDGGYTLYLGSKSSEHFCRLYDKGAESGEAYYSDAWRFEVELHNNSATEAARYLLENRSGLEGVVCSTVYTYYAQRGIVVPWTANQALNALRSAVSLETDDARSLRWLAAQVKPTVARLIQSGYTSSVLEALGLAEQGLEGD